MVFRADASEKNSYIAYLFEWLYAVPRQNIGVCYGIFLVVACSTVDVTEQNLILVWTIAECFVQFLFKIEQ